jgi:phospholipase A1/A2
MVIQMVTTARGILTGLLLVIWLLIPAMLTAADKPEVTIDQKSQGPIFLPSVSDETPDAFLQSLEQHKPIYVVNSWLLNGEGSDQGYLDQELLLHVSFKRRIFWNLFFAYSHKAIWQIYDHENSRPFREHNYNPEVFLEWDSIKWIDDLRLGLIEHESNGEKLRYADDGSPVNHSRTWNRVYVFGQTFLAPAIDLGLKLWIVTDSDDPEEGSFIVDNSDIQGYMGSGELTINLGTFPRQLSIMIRNGWKHDTETIRVDARMPLHLLTGMTDRGLDLYFQLFSGYGDTLIDYNRKITRFSAGLAFR